MNIILQTDRLILRKFTKDDVDLIFELNKDPEVTRYTHDPMTDMDHAKMVLEKIIIPQYTSNNYGRWAVHLKTNLEFIGWCGLKNRPERKEVDLGFRYMKKYWSQGYATEAARACLQYGLKVLNIKKIMGRAEPENLASCRVLEKCNMHFIGNEVVDGFSVRSYEIS